MENKKVIIGLVVGVIALILLTIGATYAYFTFNSNNEFGTQIIDADIEELGSGVTLTNLNSELSLDIKVTDMLQDKVGTTYYASGSETPAQIAKMSVDGAGTFNCSYTIEVEPDTTDAGNALVMNVTRANELIFSINENTYDMVNFDTYFTYDEESQKTLLKYNGRVTGITSANDEYITANLALTNTNEDQTAFAGDDMTLTMKVTNFECKVQEEAVSQLGGDLLAVNSEHRSSEQVNGLYRYVADAGNYDKVDNYICFGTSNKDECTTNADKFMYRIIGIDDNGLVKVVKKEALDEGMKWNETTSESRIPWNTSSVYTNLNGSAFLGNTTYVPSGWSDKIAQVSWKYGNMENGMGETNYYAAEMAFTNSVAAKVGLLYISDYEPGGDNWVVWINLGLNDTTPPTGDEWTIQEYYSVDGQSAYVFTMGEGGKQVIMHSLDQALSVRPVFYITNSSLAGGTGLITDPFMIN